MPRDTKELVKKPVECGIQTAEAGRKDHRSTSLFRRTLLQIGQWAGSCGEIETGQSDDNQVSGMAP